MSKNKTLSKSTFQDEWLCNDKYSGARCLICRRNQITHMYIHPASCIFFLHCSIFENYLTVFQSDARWVPFLSDALEKIFLRLLGLIYKKDSMAASGGTSKMLKKDWLMDKENL